MAKGTPAIQPPTTRSEPPTHPGHTSDSQARGEKDGSSDEDENGDSSPPQEEESTLAEELMTAAGVMPSDKDNDDTNSTSSESSSHLPQGKLRWAYAQLELFVKSKEEPPAWLLQLVMRDVDQSDAEFERVSDFPSEEVNPEITALDQSAVQSTHPSAQLSPRPSAHLLTHSSSAASASEQQSSDNHPPSVDYSLPAAHAATGSHTNSENPLNDSQPLGFARVSSNLIVDANMEPLLS